METKSKISGYLMHNSGRGAVFLLVTFTAWLLTLVAMPAAALAVDAVWNANPPSSSWNDGSNWTPAMAPVNAGDTATFNSSMTTSLSLSSGVTIDSMTFNPGASAFFIYTSSNSFSFVGAGIVNNSGTAQGLSASGGADCCPDPINPGSISFSGNSTAANAGLSAGGGADAGGGSISFSGNSTAGNATLIAYGGSDGAFFPAGGGGSISFSDNSTAGNAVLIAHNGLGGAGGVSFSGNSTAGNATLTAEGGDYCSTCSGGAVISFSDTSNASNATITNEAGHDPSPGGATLFLDNSTGATARVKVFGNGYLDITGRQLGLSIGSIEGSGNILIGANDLTVGTNGINTSFSGVILGSAWLAKVGSGVLTLQANDCIADTVGLIVVSGSIINLDFTGPPDVIASLKVNGVPQPPGIYGSPTSGAPHQLPQFAGSGTVQVSTLIPPWPPIVRTDPASNVANSSATLHGTADPHSLTTTVYFQYGTTTAYGSRTASQTKTGNTYQAVSGNISGLRANSVYHFRIAATNAAGTTYGADKVFTLVPDDFNHDGHPDYLLFNPDTRRTLIWYMNNNIHVNSSYGTTIHAGWDVAAVADFNLDSHPDYLLFNPTTRSTVIWYMNNNLYVTGATGPTLPADWSIAGVADFNGDGRPDYLLFDPTTRNTVIWYMDNNSHVTSNSGPTLPAGWELVTVTDFNLDDHPDYLLFNPTTRDTVIWYMNNNVHVTGHYGPTLPAGWILVGAADFTGNGYPDYLLFNTVTRRTVIWYMKNNIHVTSNNGPTLPAGWSVVAP